EHHRQHLANGIHQLAETRGLVAVLKTALKARSLAVAGEGGQLAKQPQQLTIDLFGVNLIKTEVMAQYRLVAIDQLQPHEVAHLSPADLATGSDTVRQGIAAVSKHADHFLQAGEQI